MANVLIVGCGDVGLRVARLELNRGHRVTALVRNEARARNLACAGLDIFHGDLDDPDSLGKLQLERTGVYYFAPPPSSGMQDRRLDNFLNAISEQHLPQRVVLISTTAVYGDCQGEWVTESRIANPASDRGRRRLAAEQSLSHWADAHHVEFVILRVAGIYGPRRLPVARLRKGLFLVRASEASWSNRVHVDDLVQACLAAADRGESGEIYNVSDGHPTTMTDYFTRMAEILGLPSPPQVPLADALAMANPQMRDFLTENKRIDNSKMLDQLGIALRYPELESAIAELRGEAVEMGQGAGIE